MHVAGKADIAGTTSQTGAARTYSFDVPTTYQVPGSETPVAFTIDAVDTGGNNTLSNAIGTGQLLIDDKGSTLPDGVVVNGGFNGAGAIKWFPTGAGNVLEVVVREDGGLVVAG